MFSKEIRLICIIAAILLASGILILMGLGAVKSKEIIFCISFLSGLFLTAGMAPKAFRGIIAKIGDRICKK